MLAQLVIVAAILVVGGLVVGGLVLLGVRVRVPLAVETMRRFSRLFNPRQMQTAGTPGAYASIIRHRGRASGRAYETPVGAVELDDGFVIALPYGMRSQWVRNVLASGAATIVHEGREYPVDRPELVPLAMVASAFSASDQRSHRLFRVDQGLRLRLVALARAA